MRGGENKAERTDRKTFTTSPTKKLAIYYRKTTSNLKKCLKLSFAKLIFALFVVSAS